MKVRIESIDLLRGLTIAAMILVNTPGSWVQVYAPLLHAEWHGLTPTDLIFPFFLFIVGISIYYAYKYKPNTADTYRKIAVRSFKLLALGFILNAFTPNLPFFVALETVRIPGVLQRIGIVFFITAYLYLNCNWKQLLGITVVILLGYWLFMGSVPLPGGIAPTFDRAPNNWSNFIDFKVLGKHMWKPDYDPEGILGTLPALATSILGVLIAKVLDNTAQMKALKLFAFGFVMLLLGGLWSVVFPLNKALWSSSFVLVTGGIATILLSVIYYVVDVKQCYFGSVFKYAGMNAITVYFLSSFISKCFYLIQVSETDNIHSWLYNTFYVHDFIALKLSSLLYAVSVVLVYLGLGYILFRKKIFIKV